MKTTRIFFKEYWKKADEINSVDTNNNLCPIAQQLAPIRKQKIKTKQLGKIATKPINQNYNATNVDEGMIQRYVEEYLLYFIRPSIVVANADAPLLSPRTKSRT